MLVMKINYANSILQTPNFRFPELSMTSIFSPFFLIFTFTSSVLDNRLLNGVQWRNTEIMTLASSIDVCKQLPDASHWLASNIITFSITWRKKNSNAAN